MLFSTLSPSYNSKQFRNWSTLLSLFLTFATTTINAAGNSTFQSGQVPGTVPIITCENADLAGVCEASPCQSNSLLGTLPRRCSTSSGTGDVRCDWFSTHNVWRNFTGIYT